MVVQLEIKHSLPCGSECDKCPVERRIVTYRHAAAHKLREALPKGLGGRRSTLPRLRRETVKLLSGRSNPRWKLGKYFGGPLAFQGEAISRRANSRHFDHLVISYPRSRSFGVYEAEVAFTEDDVRDRHETPPRTFDRIGSGSARTSAGQSQNLSPMHMEQDSGRASCPAAPRQRLHQFCNNRK